MHRLTGVIDQKTSAQRLVGFLWELHLWDFISDSFLTVSTSEMCLPLRRPLIILWHHVNRRQRECDKLWQIITAALKQAQLKFFVTAIQSRDRAACWNLRGESSQVGRREVICERRASRTYNTMLQGPQEWCIFRHQEIPFAPLIVVN